MGTACSTGGWHLLHMMCTLDQPCALVLRLVQIGLYWIQHVGPFWEGATCSVYPVLVTRAMTMVPVPAHAPHASHAPQCPQHQFQQTCYLQHEPWSWASILCRWQRGSTGNTLHAVLWWTMPEAWLQCSWNWPADWPSNAHLAHVTR